MKRPKEVHEMVRGAAIERDELFETANQLEAEGRDVTALSLHKALGRGSLSTVYRYFEEWKSNRPTKATVGNNEMPDSAKTAFATAWRVALKEAALETEAVKEKAAKEVEEAKNEFRGALEVIEQLEKERDENAAEIESLKEQIAKLQGEWSKEASERAAERAAGDELRQKIQEQQVELDRLRKENERERADRDTAIKDAAELKGRADELKNQNAELMRLIKQEASKPETSSKLGEFPRIRTNEEG